MIEGYVFPLSVLPGETISFHLGDRASEGERRVRLRLRLRRRPQSGILFEVEREATLRNDKTCVGVEYERGCNWVVAHDLRIEESLASGFYMMQVSVLDSHGRETGEETSIPFVVKGTPSRPAPMLVVLPTSMTLAYNNWPGDHTGRNLYTAIDGHNWHRVHVERPGQFGPTPPMGAAYIGHQYDGFLSFLSEHGLEADFGVSDDLHSDPDYLDAHRLYVSIGHDEYWSREMRDHVEAFIANGGNAAFLSANNVWWAVRFYDGKATFPGDPSTDVDVRAAERVLPIVSGRARLMVCYKEAADPIETRTFRYAADPSRATHYWHDGPPGWPGPDRPGSTLTGLSSRRGGHYNTRPLPEAYFTASYPDHWIYEGAKLDPESQRIGEAPGLILGSCNDDVRVVGYETDAIDADSPASRVTFADTPNLSLPPYGFEPLEEEGVAFGNIVMFRRNGTVFSAGSIGWCDGLNPVDGQCRISEGNTPGSPSVRAITKNVLRRLSLRNPAEVTVPNRGFERWRVAGAPDGWHVEGDGRVRRKAKREDVRRNASFSAELEAGRGPARLVSSACAVEPGRWYRVTAWVRTRTAGGQTGVELVGYARGVPEALCVETNSHSGSGVWELLCAVGQVPEGLHEARVHVRCDAGCVLEVDDVLVEDLERLGAVDNEHFRMSGQHARGVPLQNADFEGDWSEGVPFGWSGSNCARSTGWRGGAAVELDGRRGPAHLTQRMGPIEWRSYYRMGMWTLSDTPGGAAVRLYRLEARNGPRVEQIGQALSVSAEGWAYTWDLGGVEEAPEEMPEVFWAELELSAAPGTRVRIGNVSLDVVGTFDEERCLD